MKKVLYILLAASAALFVSCSKENVIDIPVVDNPVENSFTGKTITFSASIDMPAATKAALSGLNINWSSGDYIGICTDNDATIVAYPITVDGSDASLCTITVNEVAGASAYYGIFRGSLNGDTDEQKLAANDFSGITFDTATTTFSGLTVGKQQVAAGSLSSYLWHSNGFPMSMAGKSSGTSLVMKPCLALFQVQIAAGSVPDGYYLNTETYTSSKGIDHDHTYSAVRGFNLYQKGSSTIYSSGDFTVQVADDGTLTTSSVDNANKGEYRQISQSAKLTAGTNYLMCLIPGGSVNSFKFDFLGYKDNSAGLSWDAVYSMNLKKAATVKPGDFYDFGTLNPLSLKKAKNEAADDAADEAAASYVPAITIDGDMSDWSGVPVSFSDSGNSRIREWRFKSDAQMIYLYIAMRKNRAWDATTQLYIGFNKDNDTSTGNSYGNVTGCEAYAMLKPFTNGTEGSQPVCVNGVDTRGEVYASGVGYNNGTASVYAYDPGQDLSSSSSLIYYEISIPRAYLNLPAAGNSITVGCSYAWYTTAEVSVTLE